MGPSRETEKFPVTRELSCLKHKCHFPVYLLSPSRLLKLFQDFRQHNDVCSVSSALKDLDQCIKRHGGDSSALRRREYDLASLFSEFLADAVLPVSGCVSNQLVSRFGAKLQKVLIEFGVSVYTSKSAAKAVAEVFRCEKASQSVRRLYSQTSVALRKAPQTARDAAPAPDANSAEESEQDPLPVSYCLHVINHLLSVAGAEVKCSFRRLEDAYRQSEQAASFKHSRKLCRKIEQTVFHYLRKNVSDPRKAVHKRMRDELAAIVVRKLDYAGFDKGFLDKASCLVVRMACDDAVRELAWQWAANMKKMQTTFTMSTGQTVSIRYSSSAAESADKHHDTISKDNKSQSQDGSTAKITRKSDANRPKPSTPACAPATSGSVSSSKHVPSSAQSPESDSSQAKRRRSFRKKHVQAPSMSTPREKEVLHKILSPPRKKDVAESKIPSKVKVVIDGLNVAYYYGGKKPQGGEGKKEPDWDLLVKVLLDYEQYGMTAVPVLWEKHIEDFRRNAKNRLKNVYFSVVLRDDSDDMHALSLAYEKCALLLSNDKFRSEIRRQFTRDEKLRLSRFVRSNVIQYSIRDGQFFPREPRYPSRKWNVRKAYQRK